MGMAVDANVLIYERMREEMRSRAHAHRLDRHRLPARALATIIDSQLTALIAALALFWLGSGPVRGFAVDPVPSASSRRCSPPIVTRLIVATWVRVARPKVVPL